MPRVCTRLWRLGLSRLTVLSVLNARLTTTPPAGSSAPTIDPAGTYSGPRSERAYAGGAGDLYTGHRGDLCCGGNHRPCWLLQSGGRERADTRPARILRPDAGRELRDAGRSRLLHAVRGRDRGAPGAGAGHIGHGSGAVHAFGAARHAVFSRPRSPIQTSTLQTVFRSRSRAEAAHCPTAQASVGSRKARLAFTSFRGPQPRSPANSKRLFLLRTRSPRRRHLL